jgi:hypothetical protein
MARKFTDIVQVKLRIPEWLRRKVLQAADKSGRSLNGELFHLIEEGLARPEYEALIKCAADAASVAAATRIMEALAPYLDRQAPADPNRKTEPAVPPKDLAQVHSKLVEAITLLGLPAGSAVDLAKAQRPPPHPMAPSRTHRL